jgi:formate dehydrogenase (NADP+) alpha subunit
VVVVTGSSEIITVTLNGLTVSGSPGMTILELARESGIEIPTLCSDPHLSPIGACRICIVQDERNGNLFASCVTPISPGMQINTHTEDIIAHRKNIIELMLASHPDTCMVCDKGNRCQLRQIASDIGIGLTRLYKTPQLSIIQELNPYLERDLTKCILCGKCIRACQEMVVEGAIDYYQRGFAAKPATFNDLPLENSECTFCGTCISLCPTGALSEKNKPYRGSTGISVDTTCPFCACGCKLNVETKDNSIVRVKPGDGESVNNGTACKWGIYHLDFINSPDRLTRPLIKTKEQFEESSWDATLELVASRLNEIKQKHGPNSIAFLGSPNCTNEDNYILQRFARTIIGTNNIDSLCFNTPSSNVADMAGTMIDIDEIENADLIIAINTDPENTAPIVSYAIKKAARFKKIKLITINPETTKLSGFSSIWLRPETGTEAILLNILLKSIVETDTNEKSVNIAFSNYPDFIKSQDAYQIDKVEKITGVTLKQVMAAAKAISKSKNPVFIIGSNTQYEYNHRYLTALKNLILVLSSINGDRVRYLNLQSYCNSLGMEDMGISPYYLPGYQAIDRSGAIKKFKTAWADILPTTKGKGLAEMLSGPTAIKNNLKALYIIGSNPLTNPTLNIEQIFPNLDFLVVQDLFLTETAKVADVVLPAVSFAEKTGTFTNLEGKIQKLNKIYSPVGESLADWEILVLLSYKMGKPLPYKSIKDIMTEIEKLVPIYQGFSGILKSPYRALDTINQRNTSKTKINNTTLSILENQIDTISKRDHLHDYTDIQNAKYFGTGTRTSKSLRFVNNHADELISDSSHK